MPVTYRINSAGTPDIPGTNEFTPIHKSFLTWDDIRTAKVQFGYGGTTDDGKICNNRRTVVWGTSDQNKPLAETIFCGSLGDWRIDDADVVLNDNPVWRIGKQKIVFDGFSKTDDTLDVQSLVAHEVGHVLGIGHSEIKDSNPSTAPTMTGANVSPYPFLDNLEERSLEADDRNAAASIYPGGPDDATFVSTTLPTTGSPGQIIIGEITMKNAGSSTWRGSNGYELVARENPYNPYDFEDNWPVCYTCQVSPGSNYTFTVYVPYTMDVQGVQEFFYQMRKSLFFGERYIHVINFGSGGSPSMVADFEAGGKFYGARWRNENATGFADDYPSGSEVPLEVGNEAGAEGFVLQPRLTPFPAESIRGIDLVSFVSAPLAEVDFALRFEGFQVGTPEVTSRSASGRITIDRISDEIRIVLSMPSGRVIAPRPTGGSILHIPVSRQGNGAVGGTLEILHLILTTDRGEKLMVEEETRSSTSPSRSSTSALGDDVAAREVVVRPLANPLIIGQGGAEVEGFGPFGFRGQFEISRLATTVSTPIELTVQIYDLRGRRVRTLFEGVMESGTQMISWDGNAQDGRPVPSGIYYLTARTDEEWIREPFTLIRR